VGGTYYDTFSPYALVAPEGISEEEMAVVDGSTVVSDPSFKGLQYYEHPELLRAFKERLVNDDCRGRLPDFDAALGTLDNAISYASKLEQRAKFGTIRFIGGSASQKPEP
jgi:hypothetical protein